MCAVSMIGDHYRDKWQHLPGVYQPNVYQSSGLPAISREEFEKLKADVEEMKALLTRAKEYDERNNEPACETDEKMAVLRAVAKLVGISLEDVLKHG